MSQPPLITTKFPISFCSKRKVKNNIDICFGELILVEAGAKVTIIKEFKSDFGFETDDRLLIATIDKFELKDNTISKLIVWVSRKDIKLIEEDVKPIVNKEIST